MTVELAVRDGVPIAHVAGSLDMTNAHRLSQALGAAVPNAALGLVIDLRWITHLDSAGVHILFETIDRLARRQQRLAVVVSPQSLVADIAAATDLVSYASVVDDLDAAVAKLRRRASA
jgi:anti-anti-sigma factor